MKRSQKKRRDLRDFRLINAHATELNRDALDGLGGQAPLGELPDGSDLNSGRTPGCWVGSMKAQIKVLGDIVSPVWPQQTGSKKKRRK